MYEKLINILNGVGVESVPDNNAELSSYGLDSFTCVLLFSELEKQFDVTLNASTFNTQKFSSINSIVSYLRENGVK